MDKLYKINPGKNGCTGKRGKKSGFWCKVGLGFRLTIQDTIFYSQTIIEDLNLVLTAIEADDITEKEVRLLSKIGERSEEYNQNNYPKSFNGLENYSWHEYGNPNFFNVEEMYRIGRDYFITLQDASNASSRLEDYMNNRNTIKNNMNVYGNVINSQIQQGTNRSSQHYESSKEFDYDKAFDVLTQIQKYSANDLFRQEFGDKTEELHEIINEAVEEAHNKTDSKKLKELMLHIKSFAANISSGIIANGIFQLLQNGFPNL